MAIFVILLIDNITINYYQYYDNKYYNCLFSVYLYFSFIFFLSLFFFINYRFNNYLFFSFFPILSSFFFPFFFLSFLAWFYNFILYLSILLLLLLSNFIKDHRFPGKLILFVYRTWHINYKRSPSLKDSVIECIELINLNEEPAQETPVTWINLASCR